MMESSAEHEVNLNCSEVAGQTGARMDGRMCGRGEEEKKKRREGLVRTSQSVEQGTSCEHCGGALRKTALFMFRFTHLPGAVPFLFVARMVYLQHLKLLKTEMLHCIH